MKKAAIAPTVKASCTKRQSPWIISNLSRIRDIQRTFQHDPDQPNAPRPWCKIKPVVTSHSARGRLNTAPVTNNKHMEILVTQKQRQKKYEGQ